MVKFMNFAFYKKLLRVIVQDLFLESMNLFLIYRENTSIEHARMLSLGS